MMLGRVLATSQASPVRRAPTTASCIEARTTPRTREAMVPAAIPAVERARLVPGEPVAPSSTGSLIGGEALCGGAGRAGGSTAQGPIDTEHKDCLLYTSDAADDLTRVDLGG